MDTATIRGFVLIVALHLIASGGVWLGASSHLGDMYRTGASNASIVWLYIYAEIVSTFVFAVALRHLLLSSTRGTQ